MCAEFWIQNKDINFFSTKAVTIVRKRFLSHYFFNLFLLFSTSCIKAIKLKLTCYCIKNSMFFLMFLMKKLHQQRLQSFFYNNIVFSLNDSIDGVSFNIDLSIIENKIDASTCNVNIIDAIEVGHKTISNENHLYAENNVPSINIIEVEHETVSNEKQILYAENKAVNLVQPLGNNEPYEPEFIIVSSGQESKLHPSIMKKFFDSLSEKDKRRYAAIEAMRLGHGGQTCISKIFGCDRKTIRKGIQELENFPRIVKYDSRIRKRGGGRKITSEVNGKKLDAAFLSVMEPHKAGNPMNEDEFWTNLSRPAIASKLHKNFDIRIGDHVVKRLLKGHKFGTRKAYKNMTRKSVAHRNDQFEYITLQKIEHECTGDPQISVDSKKKEFLTLYRKGRLSTQKTIVCPDHDFPSYSDGRFTPYGIYDIGKNKGFVTIGINNATTNFACDSIQLWWEREGRIAYPSARRILILCDGSGNNSSRGYLFKYYLQHIANETKLEIRVAHYPPYCSKYNPIEHRLFPHVTRACQGVIFNNYEQVHKYIETTNTKTGLSVNAEIIRKGYEKGQKLTTNEIDSINIYHDDFLGKWNYRILPNN
jgi:hypothetical protein